jgi:hypothetical protein
VLLNFSCIDVWLLLLLFINLMFFPLYLLSFNSECLDSPLNCSFRYNFKTMLFFANFVLFFGCYCLSLHLI